MGGNTRKDTIREPCICKTVKVESHGDKMKAFEICVPKINDLIQTQNSFKEDDCVVDTKWFLLGYGNPSFKSSLANILILILTWERNIKEKINVLYLLYHTQEEIPVGYTHGSCNSLNLSNNDI